MKGFVFKGEEPNITILNTDWKILFNNVLDVWEAKDGYVSFKSNLKDENWCLADTKGNVLLSGYGFIDILRDWWMVFLDGKHPSTWWISVKGVILKSFPEEVYCSNFSDWFAYYESEGEYYLINKKGQIIIENATDIDFKFNWNYKKLIPELESDTEYLWYFEKNDEKGYVLPNWKIFKLDK